MILPITVYGNPILKKKPLKYLATTKACKALIDNMFETMQHARGVGLAALKSICR